MKYVVGMLVLAASMACFGGCNTCRNLAGGLFHRGDRCLVCPPADCPPGTPRATMMLPTTPQVLPGPIEIAPSP
jgi:hypothetical protein